MYIEKLKSQTNMSEQFVTVSSVEVFQRLVSHPTPRILKSQTNIWGNLSWQVYNITCVHWEIKKSNKYVGTICHSFKCGGFSKALKSLFNPNLDRPRHQNMFVF